MTDSGEGSYEVEVFNAKAVYLMGLCAAVTDIVICGPVFLEGSGAVIQFSQSLRFRIVSSDNWRALKLLKKDLSQQTVAAADRSRGLGEARKTPTHCPPT